MRMTWWLIIGLPRKQGETAGNHSSQVHDPTKTKTERVKRNSKEKLWRISSRNKEVIYGKINKQTKTGAGRLE